MLMRAAAVWSILLASSAGAAGPAPVVLANGIGVAVISRDGRWLLAGGNDGEIGRWDLSASGPGQTRSAVGAKAAAPIRMLASTADGRRVVAVDYAGVARLWDAEQPGPGVELKDEAGAVRSICVSGDDRWVVTGGDNGNVRLWNLGTGGRESTPLRGAEGGGRVGHVYVTADGRWLATGATTGPAFMWDLKASPPAERRLGVAQDERSIWPDGFSPDGRWLVSGSEGKNVRLWDVRAGGEPAVLAGHQQPVLNTEFSPNGHWLATASSLADEGADPTVRLWDLTAANVAASGRPLAGHTGRIRRMQMSADSHWLVTTSDDGTARRWDLTAADPGKSSVVYTGHQDRVMAVAITPDSARAATSSLDGTVRVWKLGASAAESTTLESGRGGVDFVKIGGNGRWLMAQTTSNALLLWDLRAVP